ncbi:MAG TPA: BON domain-containing protein [Verrucomicrobiae bacterium]|jgi:osmotically-inducible protein OsmY|nr:BON domain-containing protein [Verrucomicrobiae bacterium]
MKMKIFACSLATAISVFGISVTAAPVTSTGSGTAVRIIPPGVTPAQPTIPGTPERPGIPPSTVTSPINGTSTIATNPVVSNPTNSFATTNQNQFAATNGMDENNNLAGNPNGPNSNFALRDQAVTPSDRVLLNTLRQGVETQLGTASAGGMPVHFFINNGAVTIVGTVPTADESQRILARVQQTPGVLSTFNDLHVGTPSTVVQPRTGALGQTVGDHAFSPADRALLTTVEQQAGMQLGINGASVSQMPVHFSIQNGVVGAIGTLNSAQEKAALLAAIARTPGVTRVVDDISLTSGAGVNASTPPGANPATGPLAPTSRDGQTNNFMLNTTNASGF